MNSKALEQFAKLGAFESSDKELLPRDERANPLGLVKESALESCWEVIPKLPMEYLQFLFLKAQSEALNFGLVGAHCILDELDQLEAIRTLDKKGQVTLKLGLFLPIKALAFVEQLHKSERKKFLNGAQFRVLGFKLFADGSLGARTAALSDDYSDDQGNRGILNYSDSEIVNIAKRVKVLRLVLATHAIGDRAIEQVLRAYRKAGIEKEHRFRIEHCSIVKPRTFRNYSRAILSIQPMFATSDYWLKNRIGDNSERVGYPFRTLAKANFLVGGSDAPIESLNPLTGIRAAIYNKADKNESLSLTEAIKIYTLNGAELSSLTASSGSLEEGKTCDLVVLDTDDANFLYNAKVKDLFINGNRIVRKRSKEVK
jgi:predicted amidohydrolase YtcJ